jgi:hypothetical protein
MIVLFSKGRFLSTYLHSLMHHALFERARVVGREYINQYIRWKKRQRDEDSKCVSSVSYSLFSICCCCCFALVEPSVFDVVNGYGDGSGKCDECPLKKIVFAPQRRTLYPYLHQGDDLIAQ